MALPRVPILAALLAAAACLLPWAALAQRDVKVASDADLYNALNDQTVTSIGLTTVGGFGVCSLGPIPAIVAPLEWSPGRC